MKTLPISCATVLALGGLGGATAHAQFAVFDATNLIQTTSTAISTAQCVFRGHLGAGSGGTWARIPE
jgi:conjugal transfer/entry exclusion protein